MKVLIVSKFFYARGGADVVAMTTRRMLLDAGHQVRVFAMDYPDNVTLPESESFASQIDFDSGLVGKVKAFRRLMGVDNVVPRFKAVLDEFRPDVVHFHNIHSYLSPAVVLLAHQAGARTVWTVHDLKLVCPAYLGRRPDGTLCSDCIDGRFRVMENRCMKGSALASFMALLEARRWSRRKLDEATDAFIAPSGFMAQMMRRGGFDAKKIHVVHNFIDPEKLKVLRKLGQQQEPRSGEPYFAYVGRLSAEKGVITLVKAALKAGVVLKIGGDGPLRAELERMAAGSANIVFLGNLGAADVASLLYGAAACVMPSECYENNPLAVIESLCAGTPVIGAEIGGIPELLESGRTGESFLPGDVDDLAEKLENFDPARYDRAAISRESVSRFSRATHFSKLIEIYRG